MTKKTNIMLHIIINIKQYKYQIKRCTQVPLKCKEDQICQNHCLHLYYIDILVLYVVCRDDSLHVLCKLYCCVSICLYTYCVRLIAVWQKASLSTCMLLYMLLCICICFIVVWPLAFYMYRVLYVGLYQFYSLDILHSTFIAMMGKIDHYLIS